MIKIAPDFHTRLIIESLRNRIGAEEMSQREALADFKNAQLRPDEQTATSVSHHALRHDIAKARKQGLEEALSIIGAIYHIEEEVRP